MREQRREKNATLSATGMKEKKKKRGDELRRVVVSFLSVRGLVGVFFSRLSGFCQMSRRYHEFLIPRRRYFGESEKSSIGSRKFGSRFAIDFNPQIIVTPDDTAIRSGFGFKISKFLIVLIPSGLLLINEN